MGSVGDMHNHDTAATDLQLPASQASIKIPIDQLYLGQPILVPLMLVKLALWMPRPSEALLNASR